MLKKVPKLELRQSGQNRYQKTPPPLVQWELSEMESARWSALNSHAKAFSSNLKPRPPSMTDNSPRFPHVPQKPDKPTKPDKPEPALRTRSRGQNERPSAAATAAPAAPAAPRPALMPSLNIHTSPMPARGASLLESAEIISASEAVDQQSLNYQVKLRKNLEALHEENLKQREEKWKSKIQGKREELETLKNRELELKEVVKKFSSKKGSETEASRELARLIELKSKVKDEINSSRLKKVELEKLINEMHTELGKESVDYERSEKHLLTELESLKKQVEMSKNEKLNSASFNKENLARKKNDLEAQRLGIVEKWQQENSDFRSIFRQTDERRMEIRKQVMMMKEEKEKLREEGKVLEDRIKELQFDKQVEENNRKTAGLAVGFLELTQVEGFKVFKDVVSSAAKKMVDKVDDLNVPDCLEGDVAGFLVEFKKKLMRRKTEIAENTERQVKLIDEQIEKTQMALVKKSKSMKKIVMMRK